MDLLQHIEAFDEITWPLKHLQKNMPRRPSCDKDKSSNKELLTAQMENMTNLPELFLLLDIKARLLSPYPVLLYHGIVVVFLFYVLLASLDSCDWLLHRPLLMAPLFMPPPHI